MDIQGLVNTMGDISMKNRSQYHLTFGELIEAFENADPDHKFKNTIVGIGSYRGYYSDIALYTESVGIDTSDAVLNWDLGEKIDFDKWYKEHKFRVEKLPDSPKELAELLKSFIGKRYFEGYKGGDFLITADKPLWVAEDYGDCSDRAVVGISKELELITKIIEE